MSDNPFDEEAATWDDPDKVASTANIVARITAAVALDPSMSVLEYGAGTGLVTQALLGKVGHVTLVDSSQGMRDQMQAKVAAGTLPSDAHIMALDLEVDPVPDEHFDLIVTVLTMHHVTNLDRVLRAFATMLAAGGALCIVDLDSEDGSFHSRIDVPHHGFARDAIDAQLRDAGFGEVQVVDAGLLPHDDTTFALFLAIARHD